jgi:hypothetical protein
MPHSRHLALICFKRWSDSMRQTVPPGDAGFKRRASDGTLAGTSTNSGVSSPAIIVACQFAERPCALASLASRLANRTEALHVASVGGGGQLLSVLVEVDRRTAEQVPGAAVPVLPGAAARWALALGVLAPRSSARCWRHRRRAGSRASGSRSWREGAICIRSRARRRARGVHTGALVLSGAQRGR